MPSEREESEARGMGREMVEVSSVLSWGDSVRVAGRFDCSCPGSSRKEALFLMKPNGARFRSELLFLSIDLRRMPGRSIEVGSKERLRKLNCCSRPLRFGVSPSGSTDAGMVGAVVMMAGAA